MEQEWKYTKSYLRLLTSPAAPSQFFMMTELYVKSLLVADSGSWSPTDR